MSKKFISKNEAKKLIADLSDEFVVINNPLYIYPDYEIYPLAKKVLKPVKHLSAAVMDMDGTTTTTELLCIHSLEFMIRTFSNRISKSSWRGLDEKSDYPNIIGNSTTKHVEYLIKKYQKYFRKTDVIEAFLFAAFWTLFFGKDAQRKQEVSANLKQFKIINLTGDSYLIKFKQNLFLDEEDKAQIRKYLYDKFNKNFSSFTFNDYIRLGIDVYYQRYHEILERIKIGEGRFVADELFGDPNKHLIEAMPGMSVFLPLIKGLITEQKDLFFNFLFENYQNKEKENFTLRQIEKTRNKFFDLCDYFSKTPMKTAIVTSSIFYEADIVLREVFKVIYSELNHLLSDSDFKTRILSYFKDYNSYYDSVISASDSSEIRLKPHRDLYSIALYKLNIPKEKFSEVIGFEDSESGTIAIRAAGIGLCIAVPFAQTSGHNFKAATYICKKGIPEVLLKHNLFFK